MPLALYFKDGRAKVEIALARGKKEYDKRQTLREQQDRRETDRAIVGGPAAAAARLSGGPRGIRWHRRALVTYDGTVPRSGHGPSSDGLEKTTWG